MNLTSGHNGEHTPTVPITMRCETCEATWTVAPDDGRTVEESALGHAHGHDCTVVDVSYDGHDTITINCDPPAYRFTGDAWRGKSVNNYYVRNPAPVLVDMGRV